MSGIPRILAVDDEVRGVELVGRTLRKLGRIESATSGEEAWERIQAEPFDLVLSDQRMPGMSGVELLSLVAERDPHVGRILLTGYADLGATIDSINKGRVHQYLTKPCPPDQLRVAVASVLEHVRLARENATLLEELGDKNDELEEMLASLRVAQQRIVEAERLSAIGAMIASITHDFRGPLTVITSGSSDLSGDASLSDEAREIATQIVEESDRMTRMCAELLDVTRVSAGRSRRVAEDFDEVVEAGLAALAHPASVAGVTIETDLRSGVRFELDEERFRRVLLNLGYNAIDAMPEGGVLRVSSRSEGEAFTLAVADSGAGIPNDVAERVFEPFVTSGKRGGTGLGLAIAKKIVDEHEGRISIEKPEGGGTVFELRFPLRER